tara:strand:- start:104 stop:850 length:747 start_codon:yes stop_codon:yes gene_type:complete
MIKELQKIPSVKIKKIFIFKREEINPTPPANLNEDLKKLWKIHFNKREKAEEKLKLNLEVYEKQIIKINSLEEIRKLDKADICFVSGIPKVEKKLLKILPEYTINFHLGLLPFYKGMITGFWPFYLLQPTFFGITFHVINENLDEGEIIHQKTPQLSKGDGMHEVITKGIISGMADLSKIITFVQKRLDSKIKPQFDKKLKLKGKFYKKSDWKPEMLKLIYEKYNDKIVDFYLDGKIKCQKPKLIKIK